MNWFMWHIDMYHIYKGLCNVFIRDIFGQLLRSYWYYWRWVSAEPALDCLAIDDSVEIVR